MLPVPRHLAARLLFPNPACVLVTRNEVPTAIDRDHEDAAASAAAASVDAGGPADNTSRAFNAMTVSWLTPVDNRGGFVMSLNAQRHSAGNLAREPRFTLSPAAAGMEPLLLAVGGCSGRPPAAAAAAAARGAPGVGAAKLALCGVPLVAPGEPAAASPSRGKRKRPADDGGGDAGVPAVGGAPAHLVCRVVRALADSGAAAAGDGDVAAPGEAPTAGGGHTLLLCEVTAAWVDARYWHDGKLFGALAETLATVAGPAVVDVAGGAAAGAAPPLATQPPPPPPPPLLCFAGSQRFCKMYLAAGAGAAHGAGVAPGAPTRSSDLGLREACGSA